MGDTDDTIISQLPFELSIDKYDLSLSQVLKDYPPPAFPDTLKPPSGTKAKQLQYETIDTNVYRQGAHMVAFRIKRERLECWIRALAILYYDLYGSHTQYDVKWNDEHWDSEDDGAKSICIDLIKVDGSQLLYKITLFITTGVIQAQGHSKDTFVTHDFPALKQLLCAIWKITILRPISIQINNQKFVQIYM